MQTDANQFLSRLIQLSQLRLERQRPLRAVPKKPERYAYATAAKGYGYRMALMGFDFTDIEEKRRKFQWWLEQQGVDSDTAYSEAMRLEHSWEFAAHKQGKAYMDALDPWLGALDMTPGSVGLKLYDKYREVKGYAEWDPNAHPRGKSTPESTPGSFVGGTASRENLPTEQTFKDKTWAIGNKEHAMLFDKEGKSIAVLQGQRDKVVIHDEELKAMNGGRFIHNHPGGSAISATDYALAAKANLSQIEAYGVDTVTGEKIHWIAKRPEGGWPAQLTGKFLEKGARGVFVAQAKSKVRSKEMTVDQAAHWAANKICEYVAERLKIKLERHVV